MALTRVTGKVFGGEAPLEEIGQFGSALAGTKLNTQDVATIQALEAYSQGWGSAVITSRNFPPMEEVTGVLKTISYQACYSLQAGVPVYDIATDYGVGDIVKVASGSTLTFYVSQTTPNIGQSLSDTTYWKPATFLGSGAIGAPQFTMNPNAVLPSNCIWLEGAEVSRVDYNNLFAIYGTVYGAGDGSTTFNLPDFRGRYVCGVDNDLTFGYIAAGLPDLGLTTTSNGAHTHTRGTMNITGTGMRVSGEIFNNKGCSGAIYASGSNTGGGGENGDRGFNYSGGFNFDASRNWTGATSSNGAHTHTITSSSSLYGTTSTIKTDGIKVRVYTRFE